MPIPPEWMTGRRAVAFWRSRFSTAPAVSIIALSALSTFLPVPTYSARLRNGPRRGWANRMIRFVLIAVIVAVMWLLLLKLFREVKAARIDWTGVAAAITFVVLAFWLREMAGWG